MQIWLQVLCIPFRGREPFYVIVCKWNCVLYLTFDTLWALNNFQESNKMTRTQTFTKTTKGTQKHGMHSIGSHCELCNRGSNLYIFRNCERILFEGERSVGVIYIASNMTHIGMSRCAAKAWKAFQFPLIDWQKISMQYESVILTRYIHTSQFYGIFFWKCEWNMKT